MNSARTKVIIETASKHERDIASEKYLTHWHFYVTILEPGKAPLMYKTDNLDIQELTNIRDFLYSSKETVAEIPTEVFPDKEEK